MASNFVPDRGNVSLCFQFQTDEKPAHLHLAFAASSREQVDAFYHAALNTGSIAMARRFAAQLPCPLLCGIWDRPDGHNIEAVCHNPMIF